MQYFDFRIGKNFEENLTIHIRNSFYSLTFGVDKRNKLSFDTLFNSMKDNNKLGIKYAINKSLKGFHPAICRQCKKTYLEGTKIKKCTKCGERVDKVRTSGKYLQNRLEDVEIKVEFSTSIYYFLAFTIVV